jgi:transcription initiation factor TFIID subunit 2
VFALYTKCVKLLNVIRAPDVDHEVRWCLLKLADILVRGTEEAPPKVTIHLPPTPVTEVPPPLPPVKVALKPPRPLLKTDVTSTRSPSSPFVGTPKLKLPPTALQASASVNGPSTPVHDGRKPGGAIKVKKEQDRQEQRPARPDKQPTTKPLKVRTSGMTANEVKGCRKVLQQLRGNTHAQLFLQPVDPVRDKAPR